MTVHLSPPDAAQDVRLRRRPDGDQHDEQPASKLAHSDHGDEKKKVAESGTRKTFGRTESGQVFAVPKTHDMVSQLLSPSQPKNVSDLVVIVILVSHIAGLAYIPRAWQPTAFGGLFIFWRLAYNAGIGYLLSVQSNHHRLVSWARRSGIFDRPESGRNRFPGWYSLLKREMEVKIPDGYSFEEAPVEYNTWLLFRKVVDLILMCDFTSYGLFAISCMSWPEESVLVGSGRWLLGIGLVLFNLWVKLDAHRVVKDYAWYWGDFFFLIDQELTFDGVFEMAPHPMYSVGYAGYYGISLMAASYRVLFISIAAHAAQFAFLILVENPHIEKTYNPDGLDSLISDPDLDDDNEQAGRRNRRNRVLKKPSMLHNLMGVRNIDFHRLAHFSSVLVVGYTAVWALSTADSTAIQAAFVVNAVGWRVWCSVGIGYILKHQSAAKTWTRHFIKYGESVEEAWRQWKSLYYVSMVAYNASLIAAAYKMYALPADWGYELVLVRHIVGCALICLQVWTSASIYGSLGEFGWFFGDFFFDESPKLTYDGIYRFLNNPERVLGLAGVWGYALITWSRSMLFIALLSHILTLSFIGLVEQPHMQKLYGQSLRQDSGLSKSLKKTLPEPIRNVQNRIDQVLTDARDVIEDFFRSAGPMKATVDGLVKDSSAILKTYPARLKLSVQSLNVAGVPDRHDYSVSVVDHSDDEGTATFAYGEPIRVRWHAPGTHDPRDWIGLYRVSDNSSRSITHVSSQGRWIAVSADAYDDREPAIGLVEAETMIEYDSVAGESSSRAGGLVQFSGNKLWWTPGLYEIRYHHNERHSVMAISAPIEIRLSRFQDKDFQKRVERRREFRKSAANTPTSKTPPFQIDSPGLSTPISARSLKPRLGSLLSEEILARLSDNQDDHDSDYEAETNRTRITIEQALLPIVQNCLDRDPILAPSSVTDVLGRKSSARKSSDHSDEQPVVDKENDGLVEIAPKQAARHITVQHASRITNAINQMFGIEFHPTVVSADGTVRRLATRICVAKRVLEKTGIVDGV